MDLSGAATLDQVFTLLADAADRQPDDVWITGFDLDVNVFDGEPLTPCSRSGFPGGRSR